MTSLNIAAVQELSKLNPTTKAVLIKFSRQRRVHPISLIEKNYTKMLEKGFKISREDYMNSWKEFERVGLGSIVYTKEGDSKFNWNYNLNWVGKAALSNPKAGEPRVITQISKRGRPKGAKNRINISARNLRKEYNSEVAEQVIKVVSEINKLLAFAKAS